MWLLFRNAAARVSPGIFLPQHFDVTAQGDRCNHILSAILAHPGLDGLAETDGKAQDLDAAAACNPKVTELVDGDQDAQGDYQGDDIQQHCLKHKYRLVYCMRLCEGYRTRRVQLRKAVAISLATTRAS
jgi:hypothetical protein